MSRKGGRNKEQQQRGGAHGRSHHAEGGGGGKSQVGIISSCAISLLGSPTETAVRALDYGRHHRLVETNPTSLSPTARSNSTVFFQDGEQQQQTQFSRTKKKNTTTNKEEEDGEVLEENNMNLGVFSSSSSLVISSFSSTLQQYSNPLMFDTVANKKVNDNRKTTTTTTFDTNKHFKNKYSFSNSSSSPSPPVITTSNHNTNTDSSLGFSVSFNKNSLQNKLPACIGNHSKNNENKTDTDLTSTMAISDNNLQYLNANSSPSEYNYEEDLNGYSEEEEEECVIVDNSSAGEWFKSRCRNLEFGLVDDDDPHHQTQPHVVDTLDIGSVKASKDIVVDDLFSGEHLAVSPDPSGVISPLAVTDHVVLQTTQEPVLLYTPSPRDTNDHSIILNTIENTARVPSSIPCENKCDDQITSVTKTCTSICSKKKNNNNELNSTTTVSSSLFSQSQVSPVISTCGNTLNATTKIISKNNLRTVIVQKQQKDSISSSSSSSYCSSIPSLTVDGINHHHQQSNHHLSDGQDTLALCVVPPPLLDFKCVGTDKSNTLMTPQELESMPDQGIEFEESVGPKQDNSPPLPPSSLSLLSNPCLGPASESSGSEIAEPEVAQPTVSSNFQNSAIPETVLLETPTQIPTLTTTKIPTQTQVMLNPDLVAFTPTTDTTTTSITNDNSTIQCTPSRAGSLVSTTTVHAKTSLVDNPSRKSCDPPTFSNKNKTLCIGSSTSNSRRNDNTTLNPSATRTVAKTCITTTSTKTTTTANATTTANNNNNIVVGTSTATPLNTNFTLATISISTDKSTNSTQILVNTSHGQQLYRINTADLTKAQQALPIITHQGPQPTINGQRVNTTTTKPSTASSSSSTKRIISSTANSSSSSLTNNGASSQTGYLLLPMTPADNSNDIHRTKNPVTIKKEPDDLQGGINIKEEEVYEDSENKEDSLSELSSVKKVWPCEEAGCEQVFEKLSKLKIHLMRHTGERPFRCNLPDCDWAFTTAYKLKRHIESHQGRKDYICDIDSCGRKFTTIYNLNSHKKLHERPCNEVCPKPNCDQRFPTKRQLDLHLKNHTDVEKTYKCPVEGCDKVFLSPNYMGSHARVHQQDQDKLVCKYEGCGKIFSKVCRLKLHMRCHTGEKPYQCRFEGCTWAFATASKLKRHMSKHTGVRKWLCNACGKAFMRAEHLKGHMVKHTGTKPFQCSVDGCKTRFTAKSSLYIHLKKHNHSGEKIIYPCPMEGCQKKYSTKVSLRNHIMKHYNPNSSSASDSGHFDLVPLLVTDYVNETMDLLGGQQTNTVNQATPVSGVSVNNPISSSIIGTMDPVLVGSSDYVSTDSEKLLSVAVNSARLFSPTESLPQHGITLRDPETGITYVQTQLLQDDPPNPELYPGESNLVSDLSLHDATSTPTEDTGSEPGVSVSKFTGTTINLQDLE